MKDFKRYAVLIDGIGAGTQDVVFGTYGLTPNSRGIYLRSMVISSIAQIGANFVTPESTLFTIDGNTINSQFDAITNIPNLVSDQINKWLPKQQFIMPIEKELKAGISYALTFTLVFGVVIPIGNSVSLTVEFDYCYE